MIFTKRIFYTLLLHILFCKFLFCQEIGELSKIHIGASYGTSIPLGDFRDTDLSNPNAGFAERGQKIEVYWGKFLNSKINTTGTLRYRSFGTNADELISTFEQEYLNLNFTGNTENWQTFSLLVGASYKILITPKLDFYPRIGIGPMVVKNPELNVLASNNPDVNFHHDSAIGLGLGYEFGIGTRTEIGKRLVLLPTFTFSGGIVRLDDVETIINNSTQIKDYKPKVHSFNFGFSLAYRFY